MDRKALLRSMLSSAFAGVIVAGSLTGCTTTSEENKCGGADGCKGQEAVKGADGCSGKDGCSGEESPKAKKKITKKDSKKKKKKKAPVVEE